MVFIVPRAFVGLPEGRKSWKEPTKNSSCEGFWTRFVFFRLFCSPRKSLFQVLGTRVDKQGVRVDGGFRLRNISSF